MALAASLLWSGGLSTTALAEPPSAAAVKEAGQHFQRGVQLYNEADYRAALVEFQRAYQLAPNAAVLYNIGQTYFQLQNYAAALTALQRYMNESGAGAAHRGEVEQTMETLKARVGKITLTTSASGCEVTVDDELVGKTPLDEPILVSIGRRRVSTTCPGRSPENRMVDVAAGDTVPLSLTLGEAGGPAKRAPSTPDAAATKRSGSSGRSYVTASWIVTGALGAGALTTGVLAFLASRDLKDARDTFPVTQDDLNRKSSKVKKLSLTADILGVATLVAGGISLKLTLSRSSSHEVHVAVAPNGLQIAGSFR